MTEYATQVCRRCGNLKSICSDPNLPRYPQRSYCYTSAVEEQTWRALRAKYGPPDDKSGAGHITDGLRLSATTEDLTPDDDFLSSDSVLAARSE